MSVEQQDHDVAAIMGGLYGNGIIGLKQAFSPQWADRLYGEHLTELKREGLIQ